MMANRGNLRINQRVWNRLGIDSFAFEADREAFHLSRRHKLVDRLNRCLNFLSFDYNLLKFINSGLIFC